ncbi:MAG: ABC transporter substrate-binding protein [Fimbriimonas sp.]
MISRGWLLSFGLGLALAIGGCGRGGFSKTGGAKGNELKIVLNVNPTSLDPAVAQDVDTADLLINIYEPLVSYNEKNEIVGQLAETWTVENEGKTFVFTLRAAKFHNGQAVTAEDVKATFERNLGPKSVSTTAKAYLTDIVGANERLAGKAESVSGVEVRAPNIVAITLDKPRPYFLGKLTYGCAYILPKSAANKEISSPADAIGTGPFVLKSFAPEQEVILEPFADYYGGRAKVDRIVRPIVKDATTRLNLMKSGDLSYLGIQRSDIKEASADPALKALLVDLPRPAVWYLGLNQDVYKPFRDMRVRRAFAMAFDRARICSEVLQGTPEAKGLVPPGIVGYRPDYAGLPYNPAEAKLLLAEAGFPGGKGLPPLQLTHRDQSPDARLLAEAFAIDVKKNLGVEVKLQTMEWRSFLEARNAGKVAFYVLSWYADYLDPENFLSLLLSSKSDQNRDGYRSEEFDRLCGLADVEQDAKRRIKLYQQAEDTVVEEAGRIPIFFVNDAVLVSPRVKGLKSNLFGQLPHLTTEVTP